MKKASKDEDAYITAAPKELQDILKELQAVIRKTASNRISQEGDSREYEKEQELNLPPPKIDLFIYQ